MCDETLIGLRAIKTAIKECGSVNNIPVTLDMVKTAEKLHQLYEEHLKEEQLKKQQRANEKQEQVNKKRKLEEMQTEEKRLHKKFQILKDEEKTAQETVERPMDNVYQGSKKISGWVKTNDKIEVEAGHKSLEFGQEKQNEA